MQIELDFLVPLCPGLKLTQLHVHEQQFMLIVTSRQCACWRSMSDTCVATLLRASEHHRMLSIHRISSAKPEESVRENHVMTKLSMEGLSAHPRWDTRDRWEQEWWHLSHCLNRKQDRVSGDPA